MTGALRVTVVPRDLYYHEVAYVRKLESDRADLLAALRELTALWNSRPIREDRLAAVTEQARAAIARAEGRQS